MHPLDTRACFQQENGKFTLNTHIVEQMFAYCFQSGAIKRLIPLFDRVLVQKAEAVTKTKGGIVIPEKAQAKVLKGTVVAVGPGSRNQVSVRD